MIDSEFKNINSWLIKGRLEISYKIRLYTNNNILKTIK